MRVTPSLCERITRPVDASTISRRRNSLSVTTDEASRFARSSFG